MSWSNLQSIKVEKYRCGFCGNVVASNNGYKFILKSSTSRGETQNGGVYVCPNCEKPSYLGTDKNWYPGTLIGKEVKSLPDDLNKLYLEARKCFRENCDTASVLLCRKMLMNVAVQLGATENLKFINYVDYLFTEGYLPANAKEWVDHIRNIGNEATHEIASIEKENAEDLIIFTEMLLSIIYEFPSRIHVKNEVKEKSSILGTELGTDNTR